MMLRFYFLCSIFMFVLVGNAQNVSTLITEPGVQFEGIAWGKNGKIYTLDFATGAIYRINLQGEVKQIGSFNGALGGTTDLAGNYYFSEFNTGRVIKIDSLDNSSVYASGMIGPAGILIDEENQIMYVANYSGNRISKIDMTAESPRPTTLASGGRINGPDGLAFSPEGDLISCNFNDNNIQRISPDGAVTPFTTLTASQNSGYIVRWKDQYIVPGAFSPNIYSIDLDGNFSVFAGTGAIGYQDGQASAAQFRLPNGIAISPNGDTVLITESGEEGRIRMITDFDLTSSIVQAKQIQQVQISPNPSSEWLNVSFELKQAEDLYIRILNMQGIYVDTLLHQQQAQGLYQQTFTIPSHLSAGIYFLQIQAGEELYHQRWVLKK